MPGGGGLLGHNNPPSLSLPHKGGGNSLRVALSVSVSRSMRRPNRARGLTRPLSRRTRPRIMHDKILIIDFGSQVTQLIARRVREEGVYSEIVPFHQAEDALERLKPKAVILS